MSRERAGEGRFAARPIAAACTLLLLAGASGCATAPLPEVGAAARDDRFVEAVLAVPHGDALESPDRRLAVEAIRHALATGEYSTWENPDTGNSGSVTPFVAYENLDGRSCRQFHQKLDVGGDEGIGFARACRRDDGSWEIVG